MFFYSFDFDVFDFDFEYFYWLCFEVDDFYLLFYLFLENLGAK